MERTELAVSDFTAGFNCAQSVLLAFCEDLGLERGTASRLAEGFGGGIAGQRLTCGAVTGAIMALGLYCGREDAADLDAKRRAARLCQALMTRFAAKFGSLSCGDLLAALGQTEHDALRRQGCAAYVAFCAQSVSELLLTE